MSVVFKVNVGPEIEVSGKDIVKQLGDDECFDLISDIIYHLSWRSVGETASRAMLRICETVEEYSHGEERDLTTLRNELTKLQNSYQTEVVYE